MSSTLKYVVTRTDIAEPFPSRPRSLMLTKRAYDKYAERFEGAVVLEVDGKFGPPLPQGEARRRVFRKLGAADRGYRIRIHPQYGPHLAIKKIAVEDPLEPANIYATDSIRLVYAWTFEKFDFVFNNGLYVNKPLLHGTRPPDAWDAGVEYSYDAQAHDRVMQVFNALRAEAIRYQASGHREGLPINGAIGMTSVFGPAPSTSIRRYTGDAHVTHVHVSGYPVPPGHQGEI